MLYMHLKKPDKTIESIKGWFERNRLPEWFDDPFVREMVKGVDKTDVIDGDYLRSPVFGGMSPDRLSGGCKALITLYIQDEYPVWSSLFGDNCLIYLVEIGKKLDRHIYITNYMRFPCNFEAYFPESGLKTETSIGFVHEFRRLKESGVREEW